MTRKKVAVLVSGGVDSSVALALLAQSGEFDLEAYYLKIWLQDELSFLGDCPWQEDLDYVNRVCHQFDVPVHVVPLQGAYQERVVSYTLAELRAGRTPSPDIFCNQRIKFGAFLDFIGDRVDYVASGHYAIVDRDGPKAMLRRGVDPVKDQTYFLSHLAQKQLERCIFPVGSLPKEEVRRLAREFNLPNQDRKDSQGICFLGKIPYNEFIKFHLGTMPGDIVERATGAVLGRHQGYWFHTLGQRRGLSLGGGPWFVSGKDVANNVVYVTHATGAEGFAPNSFSMTGASWFDGDLEAGEYAIKVRHGAKTYRSLVNRGGQNDEWSVRLEATDKGLSPGQFAVVYSGDRCLGGAMIHNPQVSLPSDRLM